MFQGRQPRPDEPGQRTGHVQRSGQKPPAMAG
ncbi:Hypothetical Protein XCAW_01600 [Xanthomonas citri subsp. citri Aw12879]|nr:Hypothetical Protein XCAW_01600 [Xanthomonas citri subsp. citri Aw12879]